MDDFNTCLGLLPAHIRQVIEPWDNAEEIRLRSGYEASVVIGMNENKVKGSLVSEKDLLHVIEVATGASLHSSINFLNSGYLNYRGLRIGVCGHAVYKNGQLSGFRKYSSVAIRIPHQINGLIPEKISSELRNNIHNTLIVASPGLGKTTALREIVRNISNSGTRVSLIDERGELAGEGNGFEIGKCTDVLSFVPKTYATTLMLRAMNPLVIAMDEISKREDIECIYNIIGCGVKVIATAHGSNIMEMNSRPLYRELLSKQVFENIITISLENGQRLYTLERISQ